MSKRKDGGPAYPNPTPSQKVWDGEGMSLRDYFAGQALVGVLSNPYTRGKGNDLAVKVTDTAYAIADFMLESRSK